METRRSSSSSASASARSNRRFLPPVPPPRDRELSKRARWVASFSKPGGREACANGNGYAQGAKGSNKRGRRDVPCPMRLQEKEYLRYRHLQLLQHREQTRREEQQAMTEAEERAKNVAAQYQQEEERRGRGMETRSQKRQRLRQQFQSAEEKTSGAALDARGRGERRGEKRGRELSAREEANERAKRSDEVADKQVERQRVDSRRRGVETRSRRQNRLEHHQSMSIGLRVHERHAASKKGREETKINGGVETRSQKKARLEQENKQQQIGETEKAKNEKKEHSTTNEKKKKRTSHQLLPFRTVVNTETQLSPTDNKVQASSTTANIKDNTAPRLSTSAFVRCMLHNLSNDLPSSTSNCLESEPASSPTLSLPPTPSTPSTTSSAVTSLQIERTSEEKGRVEETTAESFDAQRVEEVEWEGCLDLSSSPLLSDDDGDEQEGDCGGIHEPTQWVSAVDSWIVIADDPQEGRELGAGFKKPAGATTKKPRTKSSPGMEE
ncbi:hypothetical protein QOT17_009878 [Balamuthia mandrillaris]